MLNLDSQRRAQGAELAELLAGDVVSACAGLVGCVFARRLRDGRLLQVQLVELEAYHQREPGCHAHRGQTPRTAVMFGPPGRLYVYFTYGMWHCANIVCEAEGTAAAVLMRAATLYPALSAAKPGAGRDSPSAAPRLHGPGLLCQALQLERSHSGMQLSLADPNAGASTVRGRPSPDQTFLYRPAGLEAPPLSWSTRVGFSFQDTYPWRCYWTGHPAVGKVSLRPLRRSRQHGPAEQPG